MWLGHVARMNRDRLPKTMLFGWRTERKENTASRKPGQIAWATKVMRRAGISELDWFRLAQEKGPNGLWQKLIDRTFPQPKTTKQHDAALNAWQLGEPIPAPPAFRKRKKLAIPMGKLRNEKTLQAERAAKRNAGELEVFPCPACTEKFTNGQTRRAHYEKEHAVKDLDITTLHKHTCGDCKLNFRTACLLKLHVCEALGPRPIRQGEKNNGWLPVITPVPPQSVTCWHIFTDGSGLGEKAGWGVAIFADGPTAVNEKPLYEIYGPVVCNRTSHLWLGAEKNTNNTGELSAMIEAMIWLLEEAPGKATKAKIWYDSTYAAGITTGQYDAKTNTGLADRGAEYKKRLRNRWEVDFCWVKGHSGASGTTESWGNTCADYLAELGAHGGTGHHSRRWAAPEPWEAETERLEDKCRRCGRSYGFSHNNGRRVGGHEAKCNGGPIPNFGWMTCRKCGQLIGQGPTINGKEIKYLRTMRNDHEDSCVRNIGIIFPHRLQGEMHSSNAGQKLTNSPYLLGDRFRTRIHKG